MFLKNDKAAISAFNLNILKLKNLKIIFAFIFVFLLAASANIFVYLPFTPVPVTLQTLTVFFAAIILGSNYILITMSTYILAGFMGFPVFAGFKSGIAALSGPTGGFIFGFFISAFITAFVFEKLSKIKKFSFFSAFIACSLGLIVLYLFGYSYLLVFFYKADIYPESKNILLSIFNIAIRPFIVPDLVKISLITGTVTLAGRRGLKHSVS